MPLLYHPKWFLGQYWRWPHGNFKKNGWELFLIFWNDPNRTDPRKPTNYKTYFRGYSKALEFHKNPPKLSNWMCGFFRVSGQCPVVRMYMKWMSINGCLCVSDIEMINIHQKPTHGWLSTGNTYHIITTTCVAALSSWAQVPVSPLLSLSTAVVYLLLANQRRRINYWRGLVPMA